MKMMGLLSCIVALGGLLFIAPPVAAQIARVGVEQEASSDERLADLIKRLEIGMSALEELERRDALDIVQRIANELREQRARGRAHSLQEENDEIKTVRRRLRVMRAAVEAFGKVGRREDAALVERAMHVRELAIKGERGEEFNRLREAAPDRGQLAEALGDAAKLYKEWDMPDQAKALAELSVTYAEQWLRRQQAQREGPVTEGERERDSGEGLDSLATRVEIIRYARAAFAEAGDEKNARVLEGVIHFGELALEGASDEKLTRAAAAVPSKPNLIEYMTWASRKYDEWGHGKRAAACRSLAEYYTRQVRGEQHEGGEEHGAERERNEEHERDAEGDIEDLNHRIGILRIAHGAFRRAGHETAALKMQQFIHVAELQRDGADQETMAKAIEGLSMGTTIELLQKASGIYAEWGMKEQAGACSRLAEYYAARERKRGTEER